MSFFLLCGLGSEKREMEANEDVFKWTLQRSTGGEENGVLENKNGWFRVREREREREVCLSYKRGLAFSFEL